LRSLGDEIQRSQAGMLGFAGLNPTYKNRPHSFVS
jgi:hypothetical protein